MIRPNFVSEYREYRIIFPCTELANFSASLFIIHAGAGHAEAVIVSKLLALFWLFLLPVLSADPAPDPRPALDSLFLIKKDSDDASGYKPRYSSLEYYLADARTLVEAGPQAIEDTQDPSTRESKVAKQYLLTYFRANDTASTLLRG